LANAPLTRRSVSETVVQNLRVLAIDAIDPKVVNNANPATGNFGRTVTLEVTAEQAEQINVAAELGKLSLTLLSATDYASASPATAPSIVRMVAHEQVDGHVPATWAGDVSPALTGAAQERPTAILPPTITILRGFKIQGGSGKEPADPVIVKPES
jgi:Flp pilus assembly protein CpaB